MGFLSFGRCSLYSSICFSVSLDRSFLHAIIDVFSIKTTNQGDFYHWQENFYQSDRTQPKMMSFIKNI